MFYKSIVLVLLILFYNLY